MLGGQFSGKGCIHRAAHREERGADDDAFGARVKHLARPFDGVNAPSGLTRQALRNLRSQGGIVALPHGCVKVDQLHQRKARELLDPVFKIVKGEGRSFSPCTS